jgi:hypothetical protein
VRKNGYFGELQTVAKDNQAKLDILDTQLLQQDLKILVLEFVDENLGRLTSRF